MFGSKMNKLHTVFFKGNPPVIFDHFAGTSKVELKYLVYKYCNILFSNGISKFSDEMLLKSSFIWQ